MDEEMVARARGLALEIQDDACRITGAIDALERELRRVQAALASEREAARQTLTAVRTQVGLVAEACSMYVPDQPGGTTTPPDHETLARWHALLMMACRTIHEAMR